MHLTRSPRAWRIAGAGLLTLALTTGLATWPWNQTDIPPAGAQEETTATDGVADTEGQAAAEALTSGERVEVLNLRSEQRDVFAEPDGTFSATEYAVPIRTLLNGEWADIDPTLILSESGVVVPVATTVAMRFAADDDQPLVTISKNNHTMTLDWPGPLPEPTLEGPTAVYSEVLPGVDLRLTALDTGFTHTLVVKNAEAAANPNLARIEWPVAFDGAEVETTPAGGLSVVDSETLDAWLSTDTPTMWDSSGVAEAIAAIPGLSAMNPDDAAVAQQLAAEFGVKSLVGIAGSASSIVLKPDADFLTGSETVYPVYIDPIYRDETRTAWAMIATNYPEQEYWKWSNDGGEGVGTWYDGGPKKRQLFRLPTSFYSGKTIRSAEFAVALTYNWYDDQHETGYDIYLDKVGEFTSGTNWNNRPSYNNIASTDAPKPINGICKSPQDGAAFAMEWEITSTLQSVANAGTSTLSLQVRNYDETAEERWIRICNNGQLRVTYNTPPNQPLMSDMWTSPGPMCQWAVTTDSYVGRLPRLYTVATDDDFGDRNEWGSGSGQTVSEKLRVQWQLTNTSDAVIFTSAWSSPLDSGAEHMIDLNTASGMPTITAQTEIRWEARVSDGMATSAWSSAGAAPSRCRFVYDPTKPAAPTISSTDFPAGTEESPAIAPMVGEKGSFTLSTTAADVVSYRTDFTKDNEAARTITLASLGDNATVNFLPLLPGRYQLTVTAFDRAGNSAANTYSFRVSVADAAGVWLLDETEGVTADDTAAENPGALGSGVSFGAPGPVGRTAATFDGSADAYISTDEYNVASTGEGVSIAAWARIDNLAKDGVIASIDGGLGESGMTLGYRSTSSTTGQWVLSMPDMAMNAFSSWEVLGGR
nr:hypothetical protein GCM10025732_25820 [Glycomyces mayteni]